MSIFGLFIALTQVDFVIIRLSADLIVGSYTTMRFLKNKEFSPRNYYEMEMHSACDLDTSKLNGSDSGGKGLGTFSIDEDMPVESGKI